MYQSDICTVPASLAGLPALALPCGAEAEGLPVGFQLVGRALDDARLLGIGSLFQKHTGFHRRAPELQEVAR
jgi:aspartyl-tRNA(Asn)/glutamyl-tRNA(Gln) amidotransferase subunit A